MRDPVTVMVVDDAAEVLDLECDWIASQPWLDLVETAANGKDAVEKFKAKPVDLVLMDVAMPVMNGFEATIHLKQFSPAPKVVILSTYQYPRSWRSVGADAFANKTEFPGGVDRAIRSLFALDPAPEVSAAEGEDISA
jgi:CheY-like chemotaxis protein